MELAGRVTAKKVASQSRADCAACGSRLDTTPTVRLRGASLLECGSCGSWTYWPRQPPSGQEALHNSSEYFDHPYFDLRRRITPELRRRCRDTFQQLGKAVDLDLLRGEKVLDVGCDTGAFLQCSAELFGVVPVGIDVAERAVNAARQAGVEAYQTSVERAPRHLGDFPVVTAIDLIEHVADPGSFLSAIRGRLRRGGVLYLETPNIRSKVYVLGRLLCNLLGGRPAAVFSRLFPPQHVQYFTIKALETLARQNGFDIVDIGTRSIPAQDVAAAWLVRTAVTALQMMDELAGSRILFWVVLRRAEN